MIMDSPLVLLVLFVAFFSAYSKAFPSKEADLVSSLPGQPAVSFNHYAGYVKVNETNGRALFYWFFEASTQPDQKPLVLWLNGGPGCSSVGYGATQEIGPFLLDKKEGNLTFNQYSWNTEANILFLESPVGVGFSYSNTSSDYDDLGDVLSAHDAYEFLQKWLGKFPSYASHVLYIAGESYAGKYVPELAEFVIEKNKDPLLLHINIKGILLGNPETDDAMDRKGMVDYAWSHAVISDETHNTINRECDFALSNTTSNPCRDALDEMYDQYELIDMYSLYTPLCGHNYSIKSNFALHRSNSKMKREMIPKIMGGYDPCIDEYTKAYYNRLDVQRALHANYAPYAKNWSLCNFTLFENWSSSKPSMLPIYKKLIASGLRIWVYSGDTDGRVPVLSTRYSLSGLNLSIIQKWRPWYHNKQVAGWLQEYEGLLFATFRGAGHAVPTFKPSESLAFFTAFLNGKPPQNKRR